MFQSVSYGARDANVCPFGLGIGEGGEVYAVRQMVEDLLH